MAEKIYTFDFPLEVGTPYSVWIDSPGRLIVRTFDQSGNGRNAAQDEASKRPSIEPLSDLEIYLAKKAHEFLSSNGGERFPPAPLSERILREVVRNMLEAARDKGYRLVKDE